MLKTRFLKLLLFHNIILCLPVWTPQHGIKLIKLLSGMCCGLFNAIGLVQQFRVTKSNKDLLRHTILTRNDCNCVTKRKRFLLVSFFHSKLLHFDATLRTVISVLQQQETSQYTCEIFCFV